MDQRNYRSPPNSHLDFFGFLVWEYPYFRKRKLRKLNLSRENKEERRERAPPTEEIILLKWGKRYSGEARKLPEQSCQVNWQSNPSTEPTCFPTSKLVSGHSPAWNLSLEGPFPIPSPPLSLSRGLIKLLQPHPEKAPVFAWIFHPYGLGHFRYVKVDSITTGKKPHECPQHSALYTAGTLYRCWVELNWSLRITENPDCSKQGEDSQCGK